MLNDANDKARGCFFFPQKNSNIVSKIYMFICVTGVHIVKCFLWCTIQNNNTCTKVLTLPLVFYTLALLSPFCSVSRATIDLPFLIEHVHLLNWEKSTQKEILQTSPTESLCEKSTQTDSVSFSHQQQQDHRMSPQKIPWARTSSANMASTQHSSVPSISPRQQSCSLRRINESRPCREYRKN